MISYGFAGYERHETEQLTPFFYANNRFYDPFTARFMRPDPLAEQEPTLSAYVYAGNNPFAVVDPLGLSNSDLYDPDPPADGFFTLHGSFYGKDDQSYPWTQKFSFKVNSKGKVTLEAANSATAEAGFISASFNWKGKGSYDPQKDEITISLEASVSGKAKIGKAKFAEVYVSIEQPFAASAGVIGIATGHPEGKVNAFEVKPTTYALGTNIKGVVDVAIKTDQTKVNAMLEEMNRQGTNWLGDQMRGLVDARAWAPSNGGGY